MAEQENISAQSSNDRWNTIRANDTCNLSLTPTSVASYLSKPESELVQDRIQESLVQLVQYRLEKDAYVSWKPEGQGDLATCEGLEAFLVPAVEEAVSLSKILTLLDHDMGATFCLEFVADVNKLLSRWESKVFSGAPYGNETKIRETLLPTKGTTVNIVEAAAMACRVVIHLLTLKLTRDNEDEFQERIGRDIDENRLSAALTNALDFLIGSFQKADVGSDEEKIGHAKVAGEPGSGWSWTDWPGLPPMLFFTAATVDAFAELDLYLIRAVAREDRPRTPGWEALAEVYSANAGRLSLLQFCVDMARRWVLSGVLPFLSAEAGLHNEPGILYKDDTVPDDLRAELDRDGFTEPPTRLYNNLYGLQVLLWSWADWDDRGDKQDDTVKNAINRALAQLVYNYDSVPNVKRILKTSAYGVYLPRSNSFQKEAKKQAPEYEDKGFLPLLTRLLVLFVVYGVGDRNLLEPVIRNLYVELLQSRNRTQRENSALWSSGGVEVFATQRAIQALTFYYWYARGKEKPQVFGEPENARRDISGDLHDIVVFRNRTGRPLILEAVAENTRSDDAHPGAYERIQPFPDPLQAQDFVAYVRLLMTVLKIPSKDTIGEDNVHLLNEISINGKALLTQLKSGGLKDAELGKTIVYALARLSLAPSADDGSPRSKEFDLLMDLARQLGAS